MLQTLKHVQSDFFNNLLKKGRLDVQLTTACLKEIEFAYKYFRKKEQPAGTAGRCFDTHNTQGEF
jgi:hypothetical protein